MQYVLYGLVSTLSFGCADFAARFSSRALGHGRTLFGVLLVSSIILTGYLAWIGFPQLTLKPALLLIVLHGGFMVVTLLLLYQALALGPIHVAAPIVGAHPALVVLWALARGVQPSVAQWLGMLAIMAGVTIIASAKHEKNPSITAASDNPVRKTTIIAMICSVTYALTIITGQEAVPVYGSLTTLWLGRLAALVLIIPYFVVRREIPSLPVRWWPFITMQGCLDSGGFLFLLIGSKGEGAAITVVIASTFGAVTVLLAWLFLKERMSRLQWAGIIAIFVGSAVLGGSD